MIPLGLSRKFSNEVQGGLESQIQKLNDDIREHNMYDNTNNNNNTIHPNVTATQTKESIMH